MLKLLVDVEMIELKKMVEVVSFRVETQAYTKLHFRVHDMLQRPWQKESLKEMARTGQASIEASIT
jgi:hypothetical protein